MNDNEIAMQEKSADSHKRKKGLLIVLLTVLVLAVIGTLYYHYLLNLINRPDEIVIHVVRHRKILRICHIYGLLADYKFDSKSVAIQPILHRERAKH